MICNSLLFLLASVGSDIVPMVIMAILIAIILFGYSYYQKKKGIVKERSMFDKILGGAICGWLVAFMVVWGLMFNFDTKLFESEVTVRTIAFLSFAPGAIIGIITAYGSSKSKEKKQQDNNASEKSQSSAPVDRVEQLKKIKELLDAGILTQEEFNTEKSKILNS